LCDLPEAGPAGGAVVPALLDPSLRLPAKAVHEPAPGRSPSRSLSLSLALCVCVRAPSRFLTRRIRFHNSCLLCACGTGVVCVRCVRCVRQSTFSSYQSQFADMDLLGTFIDNHDNARFLRYADPHSCIFIYLFLALPRLGLTLFFFSSLAATHRQWHDRLQALPERHHLHPHGPRHPHHLRTFSILDYHPLYVSFSIS